MYLKSRKVQFLILIIAFLVLIFLLMLFSPGPLKQDALIDINKGESAYSLANKLKKASIVRNKYFFRYFIRILGEDKNLVTGEFQIPKHSSIFTIVRIITNSKKLYFRKITIPEGYTVDQVNDVLLKNPFLTGGIVEGIEEGSLMPNTYYFTKGESRASIINRMRVAMRDYLNKLWQDRDPNLPYHTKEEALILASIIEKETGNPKERFLIAGVFMNRLRKHMRLQSDPTVAYGLNIVDAATLTTKDLRKKTPYNTYRINGLPPTPIANPGKASIYAAFHPAKTSYLYFVADGEGGHFFASTLAEHNENVKKWLVIRNDYRRNHKK